MAHTHCKWKAYKPVNLAMGEEETWSVAGPPSDFMYLRNRDDALLIAAAPELLAACLMLADDPGITSGANEVILAAIAKAKGL